MDSVVNTDGGAMAVSQRLHGNIGTAPVWSLEMLGDLEKDTREQT